LIGQISSEKSSLAKQNKLSNYYNTPVKDQGIVLDIEIKHNSLSKDSLTAKIIQNLDKDKNNNYISPIIQCEFTKKESQRFLTVDFPYEIEFTGIVPDEDNFINLLRIKRNKGIIIELEDCIIVNFKLLQ
jgi:hypothetical protein